MLGLDHLLFTTLILDDLEHEIGATEPFEVIRPSEIMDIREFHRMAMLYTVVELSTAVKPSLLQTLLDRGSLDVMYLDPDIQLFAPIVDVSAFAREHSIVPTPHATEPIPNDGCAQWTPCVSRLLRSYPPAPSYV